MYFDLGYTAFISGEPCMHVLVVNAHLCVRERAMQTYVGPTFDLVNKQTPHLFGQYTGTLLCPQLMPTHMDT